MQKYKHVKYISLQKITSHVMNVIFALADTNCIAVGVVRPVGCSSAVTLSWICISQHLV